MDRVNKKLFLSEHINKVLYSIYNNETLIAWKENGGQVDDKEIEKAKASIEKDKNWLAFLEKQLNEIGD